ncbi:DNA cytosine methyltransferase [Sphingomonas sp. URHD0057]|uniref:DNA cytosine methyltransferase n=1 Tax=Sphingomonas sp. URHD0057 TaxID=1380389 RepID=UPI0005692F91|nr:DNA cytosine methyltransferase [Sphingomonas sp. URHD0057]
MRAIDLFCGAGGFSRGAHAAGFDVIAAFDKDPILTSSFKTNFPETKLVLADLSETPGGELFIAAGGEVDLMFGGPPCQGFSSIGRRDKSDPRRTLLGHFFRLVAEAKPRAFVMENVQGLAFADALPELESAIGSLPTDYFLVKPLVLDAADFGAATSRKRMFVVGYDPARCDSIWPDDFELAKSSPATVADAFSGLFNATKLATDDCNDRWKIPPSVTLSDYAAALVAPDGIFTGNQRTRHTAKVSGRFSKLAPGKIDPVGRHPRLTWNGQCPTLRAGTGADMGSYQSVRPIHPEEDRVITVREAARLQGFPDDHLFHPTIWHSFRMIGNSVSPIIAEAVLRVVAEKLEIAEESKKAA